MERQETTRAGPNPGRGGDAIMDCIFCKIARGEMKVNTAYQDSRTVAFHDINPQAPVHVLVVPTKHIESLLELQEDDHPLLGHLHAVAVRVAGELGVAESGFRVVINTNADAGQSVPHLHLHMLGGRVLGWPPG
jgi:histidine triad (HIT) family protein